MKDIPIDRDWDPDTEYKKYQSYKELVRIIKMSTSKEKKNWLDWAERREQSALEDVRAANKETKIVKIVENNIKKCPFDGKSIDSISTSEAGAIIRHKSETWGAGKWAIPNCNLPISCIKAWWMHGGKHG